MFCRGLYNTIGIAGVEFLEWEMIINDLQLQSKRVHALYVLDSGNRLLRVNETDTEQITPRFYIARTKEGYLWWARYDVASAIADQLVQIANTEPIVDDLDAPLLHQQKYIDLLAQEAPVSKVYSGPAYYLPESTTSKGAIRATAANKHLLESHFSYSATLPDELCPITLVSVDDVAVAACFCARKTVDVAEAGVFTVEAFRKRGYAVETVREWQAAVREEGILPLYSTSHENLASQAVAGKLNAVHYATDFSFT